MSDEGERNTFAPDDERMRNLTTLMLHSCKVRETLVPMNVMNIMASIQMGTMVSYWANRDSCWSEQRMKEYIERMFSRKHNPLLLMRKVQLQTHQYQIGDGVNRVLEAIVGFCNDKFSVTLPIGPEGAPVTLYYSQLDSVTKMVFDTQTNMAVLELENITDKDFEERIDKMNSGTKMKRGEHINLQANQGTPRSDFLAWLRDRYTWSRIGLKRDGAGMDLLGQVVHQMFKEPNSRTQGMSKKAKELKRKRDEYEDEEEGEEDEECVDPEAVGDADGVMKNRFTTDVARKQTIEKFMKSPSPLDPQSKSAQLIISAFDDLTDVFENETCSGAEFLKHWTSKGETDRFRLFRHAILAVVLSNIYDGCPITKDTICYLYTKARQLCNDPLFAREYNYLQHTTFHWTASINSQRRPYPHPHNKTIGDGLKSMLLSMKPNQRKVIVSPMNMKLWNIQDIDDNNYMRIWSEDRGNYLYFNVGDKRPDLTNKLREIARYKFVYTD